MRKLSSIIATLAAGMSALPLERRRRLA